MSFTRSALRSSFLRPFLAGPRTQLISRPTARFAGDYGSGEGDPKGENPQDQGSNPSADLEHPGPPPPKVGEGSGAGPTKGNADGNNTSEAVQNGGKDGTSKSSSGGGSKSSNKTEGAQPKILAESAPEPEDQSQDVKKHNADMSQRAEQADTKIGHEDSSDQTVSKDFWKGQGGRDKEA